MVTAMFVVPGATVEPANGMNEDPLLEFDQLVLAGAEVGAKSVHEGAR